MPTPFCERGDCTHSDIPHLTGECRSASANWTRTYRPGVARDGAVWVRASWTDGRLSICGVVGPHRNGDCRGSSGQIVDELADTTPDDRKWTRETIDQLADIWNRWHLNDMRPGCEHQRADGWTDRPIDPTKPTNTYGKHFDGQTSPTWNMLARVRENEHPDGLLCRPCPTCGHKYGTGWLREDVPTDVLDALLTLPAATTECPWRNL